MAALTDDEIQVLQRARDIVCVHDARELRLEEHGAATLRVRLGDVVANHTLPASLVGF